MTNPLDKKPTMANPENEGEKWLLRLYVAGETPNSTAAFANLKKVCEEYLQGKYEIEGSDILLNPTLAKDDEIFALPILVRKLPEPMKKIIGDLANTERILVGLQIESITGRSKV